MTIREEVSKVIGVPIPQGRWGAVFANLSTQGKITQRTIQDLLIIICQKLEEMENAQSQKKPV